jgi:hypothetical protein
MFKLFSEILRMRADQVEFVAEGKSSMVNRQEISGLVNIARRTVTEIRPAVNSMNAMSQQLGRRFEGRRDGHYSVQSIRSANHRI